MRLKAVSSSVDENHAIDSVLREFNALRRDPDAAGLLPILERAFDALYGASRHLVLYGSLMPGAVNHVVIAHLPGTWRDGWVRGERKTSGWGSALGFPVLRWDSAGPKVPVKILDSDALTPETWARLDAFEGEDYRRILVPVYDDDGLVCVGNLYEDAGRGPAR